MQQTIDTTSIQEQDFYARHQKLVLAVDLEQHEIAALAIERAKEEGKLAEMEALAKEKAKDNKDAVERQRSIVAKMGDDISRQKQDRVVLCDQIFRKGVIVTYRQDNGVVVSSVPATPQQAQKHLPAMEGGGLLADAQRAQKASGVDENEDGDVIPFDRDGDEKPKKGKKR